MSEQLLFSQRISDRGIVLPAVPAPVANYIPAAIVGDTIRTSGQLPFIDGHLPARGKVGEEVSLEEARECAARAALNAVAALADKAGGIDKLARIVHVTVFVASAPHFTDQAQVANGASDLLGEIFGDAAQHTRSAVGVAVLPLDSPVEVEVQATLQ